MNIGHLILKEFIHRKVNSVLALASVIIAVSCIVGTLTLLCAYDMRTEMIISAKEDKLKKEMKKMEDDFRMITKDMGFNVLIVPKEQNLIDLYSDDHVSQDMDESYVTLLANSNIATIRHLLPILTQKMIWPETGKRIILTGTRGEVPVLHRDRRKPILEPVAPGTMIAGYALHQELNLMLGQRIEILGREFTIAKFHEQRGTKDDITVWINLKEAQEMLDRKGKINGILALECQCAWADLAKVQKEIEALLPNTRVIEFASKALARAKTRERAAETARNMIETEKNNRALLKREIENFTSWLIPVVLAGCGIWLSFLAFSNARERRNEIGIFKAVGLTSKTILILFLSKVMIIGLIGSGLGYMTGLLTGSFLGDVPQGIAALFKPSILSAVLIATPLLSVIACWIPALKASLEDPARILMEEYR